MPRPGGRETLGGEKKERMRRAKEVIARVVHDSSWKAAAGSVSVGYKDRILDCILEKPLSQFSHWGRIENAAREDLAIPEHRVVYFKLGNEVVWDKRTRVDKVFGSTPPYERVTPEKTPGGEAEEAARVVVDDDVEATTALQRLLVERRVHKFEDVVALLRGPEMRCKVRGANLGGVFAYTASYEDPKLFGSQRCADRSCADLALDHCRGCIYEQDTNRLLCWAFDKFWEVEDRRAGRLDERTDVVLTEKADGVLVKVFHCGARWRLASNSCIDADRARFKWGDAATETTVAWLFRDAADQCVPGVSGNGFANLLSALTPGRCYAFEVLHPAARVVAPHARPELVHLMTRELASGLEVFEDSLLDPQTGQILVRKPKELRLEIQGTMILPLIQQAVRLVLPADREGFVARDGFGRRVKIKSAEYLQAHVDPSRTKNAGFFHVSRALAKRRTKRAAPQLTGRRQADVVHALKRFLREEEDQDDVQYTTVEAALPLLVRRLAARRGCAAREIWRALLDDSDTELRVALETLVDGHLRPKGADPVPCAASMVRRVLAFAAQHQNILVVLRGTPGSGKSTLAGQIAAAVRDRGKAALVCSADACWADGTFAKSKLAAAHEACYDQVSRGLYSEAHDVVIVDNCNAARYEFAKYVSLQVKVAVCELKAPDQETARHLAIMQKNTTTPAAADAAWARWEEIDPGEVDLHLTLHVHRRGGDENAHRTGSIENAAPTSSTPP